MLQCLWLPHLSWGVATHKVKRPFDRVVLKGQVTNQGISATTVHMATKLCKMVTYLDGLLPIKLHDPLITWLCEILGKTKTIISPLTLDQWPPKKSRNPLNIGSCEVTRQIINMVFPLSQCLWSPNLLGWWHTPRSFQQ